MTDVAIKDYVDQRFRDLEKRVNDRFSDYDKALGLARDIIQHRAIIWATLVAALVGAVVGALAVKLLK